MRDQFHLRRLSECTVTLALLLMVLTGIGRVHSLQAQTFLAGFEDLPLMPGLSVVEGAGIDFDAPSGRIAEVYATGNLTPGTVIEFYRATLRQLGWSEVTDAAFEREGESLRLNLDDANGELIVRFRLSPVGTNAD